MLNADIDIGIFCGVPKTYCFMKIMVVGGKKFERVRGSKVAEKVESLLFKIKQATISEDLNTLTSPRYW